MIRTMRFLLVTFILVGLVALVACGRDAASKASIAAFEGASQASAVFAVPAAAAPAPQGAPAPAAAAMATMEMAVVEMAVQATALAAGDMDTAEGQSGERAALVAQTRIIVRTLEIGLTVDDVPNALDTIVALAQELGGWVVASDRSQKHRGSISVRVPAEKLDGATLSLRDMAVEVEFEVSSSKDVTDEYVDITARLKNFEATEQVLFKLMERAQKVEDALGVQRELTKVRGEIESLQGRIKLLEQTSAFSLINVDLRLAPMDMSIDAGPDQSASVREPTRFRATFKPPEDIEDFVFTWDFGDGSPPVTGDRTTRTSEEDTRSTATVTHDYGDDRDSPYIVSFEITGRGPGGVVESEDTLIVTVSRLPVIEVFAGGSVIVEEGEEAELSGSFTRPKGLSDLSFSWDFGDGSEPATGSLAEGVTNAPAVHIYADHRPFAYTARLTITGQSDAGEVEASSSISVLVTESVGWVISGWSAGDAGKTGVRALSGTGQAVATFFIWVAIFSPLWIVVGVIVALLLRRRARRRGQSSD